MVNFVLSRKINVHPRIWSKDRSLEWWRGIEAGLYDDGWWTENLRMNKRTFDVICNELRPHLSRQFTKFRAPVGVEARVAVTIWKLATNIEYRTIAALFGLGRATVGEIVIDTCNSIATFLLPKYVCLPQNECLRQTLNGFQSRWGFPQTVGAIDGTHIPIMCPLDSGTDYYNRKGFYSMLIQAVVDFRGIFIDVNIGWPGKVHDARVFANSTLYQKGSNGTLFPDWSQTINGISVPLLILGDPAYPLLPWLMKPYIENARSTPEERNFNYRHSRARMVVENAFGRLKGRWRCILKRADFHILNVPNVIASCVVLHNICESHGDLFQQEWVVINNHMHNQLGSTLSPPTTIRTTAMAIRNAIKDSL